MGLTNCNSETKMFQVSTLQALALGYSKQVISVEQLMLRGDTGLGTFEDVGGEMIVLGGHCYCADERGLVTEAKPDTGVPFASVAFMKNAREFELGPIADIEALKQELDLKIEEDFGLNSMHMACIDGLFESVNARSETAFRSQHVSLKDVLWKTQKDYRFSQIAGSLVCVYYPDYMDGINAAGWHLHFISDDRLHGGHVFELRMKKGSVKLKKISQIEIRLPNEPAFDTYSLKNASGDEIKQVEQGHQNGKRT